MVKLGDFGLSKVYLTDGNEPVKLILVEVSVM